MCAALVHYAISDAVAEITLDRAPVNALSMPLIDGLLDALGRAKDDSSVRAVVIASAHKVFCAGLDLDIVRGKRGLDAKAFLARLYFALNDVQYRMGKPTIAAVDGAARAGGMTIAVSCDMIIAGEAAIRISGNRRRIDPGFALCPVAAAGWKASSVRPAVFGRSIRRGHRISDGPGQRNRSEGFCPRSRACRRATFRRKIAGHHEDWA